MESVFETKGTCLEIRLPKELDHPVSEVIRRESDKIMQRIYIKTIEFDFSETGFMDSSGIGLIMGRYRALGMHRGCIRAVNVSPYLLKLLRLSGLHKYIDIRVPAEAAGEQEGE